MNWFVTHVMPSPRFHDGLGYLIVAIRILLPLSAEGTICSHRLLMFQRCLSVNV